MKKYLQFVLFFILTTSFQGFGQSIDSLRINNDSLTLITQSRLDTVNFGVPLSKEWKYRSGDDRIWADKNFDDSNWPIIQPNFDLDSLKAESWTGICWFRRKIKIDSSLFNNLVGFELTQRGASEIYINGKLVQQYGIMPSDSTKEKRYNPNRIPFITVLDTSEIQVIAIRYSHQKAQHFKNRFPKTAGRSGFTIRIINYEKAISELINQMKTSYSIGTIGAFFLALSILHLLLFFFYSREKQNLYYALFTGAVTVLMFIGTVQNFSHDVSGFIYVIDYLFVPMLCFIFAAYVFFLYSIFYKKMPAQFWIIAVAGALISFISFLKITNFSYGYILGSFLVILTVEGLRVIIVAIRKKKRNSLIIGIGVALYVLLILFFTITSIYTFSLPGWIEDYLPFLGLIGLPISMTIYLARESAKTKTELLNRITEVQHLSEKALEQEKREAELKIENTRKEVELQKAAELKSAYKKLEESHENLKATQNQLIQSEKMASLGELTAGIAHEIQNPLNFVNNFSEVSNELIDEMQEELAGGNLELVTEISGDLKQNLEKINHHGKRAEAIVKGMLQHSRTNSGEKELTNIKVLADEYLRLSYHGLRAKDKSFNAGFKLEADKNLPKIFVVPQDIGRVFINLFNNAFFACAEKSKNPSNAQLKEKKVDYAPIVDILLKQSGNLLVIKVKDNGPGIPNEIKEKIFQPFFTTKPTGQGTGLGLSISYDIVKAHGGNMKVESTNGEGTEFTIELPLTKE